MTSHDRPRSLVETELRWAETEAELLELVRHYLSDEDPEIRMAAAHAAADLTHVDTLVRLLLDQLADESDEAVKAAVCSSLGGLLDPIDIELDEMEANLIELVYQSLLQLIQNAEEPLEVRRRALEAVSGMAEAKPVVCGLIEQFFAMTEDEARISAVFAMGRSMLFDQWTPHIAGALDNPNDGVLREALWTAGELEMVELTSRIQELTESDSAAVRTAALLAYAKVAAVEDVYCLLQQLEQDDDPAYSEIGEEMETVLEERELLQRFEESDFDTFEDESEEWP